MTTRETKRLQQAWRLAAAAEWVLARKGKDTVVADIIAAAGNSRRTFYELFMNVDDLLMSMWMRERTHGFEAVDLKVPCMSWFLVAMPMFEELVQGSGWKPGIALARMEAAREIKEPRPIPSEAELTDWWEV